MCRCKIWHRHILHYWCYMGAKESVVDFVCDLIENIDKLHTTQLGEVRIKKNLSLNTDNVVEWCKKRIVSDAAHIIRKGKNFYVSDESCILTIHARSYTIITAHRNR